MGKDIRQFIKSFLQQGKGFLIGHYDLSAPPGKKPDGGYPCFAQADDQYSFARQFHRFILP
jgi:hypothetical protein